VPGAIVSLLPVHGGAVEVSTTGLAYPLDHESLPAGTSRGISNLGIGAPAAVSIGLGTLLVISPTPGLPAPAEPAEPAESKEPEEPEEPEGS